MGWTLNNLFVQQFGLEHMLHEAWDATGTDTTQLTKLKRVAFVSSALGAGTVFLPPVHECVGMFFAVVCSSYSGAFLVQPFQGGQAIPDSVLWENEGELAGSSASVYTITATNGWGLFFSLGDRWLVVANDPDAA